MISFPGFTPRRNTLAATLLLGVAMAGIAGTQAHAQSRTIVVDAGHGGVDRGGVPGQRVGEKQLTLDVAQRLRTVLKARGYRVVMTRESDVFVPLGRRVAIANAQRGATFVSVHFNSGTRSGANGIETYYYRSDSATLAASIHRHVVAGAPTENRGIRRRGYYVLRRTSIPGVLVECGFLTNSFEASYALSASYRQKLAEEIARGIQREPPPRTRPLAAASAVSTDVLSQPLLGPDFVRAIPRSRRSSKTSKSSRSSRSSSSKKKSSSSKSKKKSSSSSSKKKTTTSED
ncbi:MAG TPA: N-acetylmuramoyl-L-alanine amidase [Chthoniobacterales bacterium]|nr:N-acetylmuramoyl-L-alanine amidase [Chthoniobacterales bacterium]